MLVAALGSATTAVAGCSKSDTVLAVTVSSSADLMTAQALIRQIRIRITPASGAPIEQVFDAPQVTILVDGGVEAGGSQFMAISSSFFERVAIPSGVKGPATVRVDAFMEGSSTSAAAGFAWNESQANIVENGAAAAQVMLIIGGPPPVTPDGGTDGGGDAGEDASADGG